RFRLYRELWGRGLHLTPGGKFGGDFLVYPGKDPKIWGFWGENPGVWGSGIREILGIGVRKALLLCAAPPGGALACTALQWRGDLA
ncbi:SEN34 endonuclease, partial [Hylia prasina]|nr:SEN34 endonuclease [Hylia prasina]